MCNYCRMGEAVTNISDSTNRLIDAGVDRESAVKAAVSLAYERGRRSAQNEVLKMLDDVEKDFTARQ